MRSIILNGEDKSFADNEFPVNLLLLIKGLKMEAAGTVAEVNGEIIRADDFDNCILEENMKIELVRFVGGG